MRSLLAILFVGYVVAFGNATVNAEPLSGIPATVPTAPIGHLQPRAEHFTKYPFRLRDFSLFL